MNTEGMLPWELKVMSYLDGSDTHVLYRVTPFFEGDDLLSRGVEMEAYSVEDNGRLSYHVFVYNVQPGIELDYATGRNWLKK
jgi:DNA-entry nuclease